MKVPARIYFWAAQLSVLSWYIITLFIFSACIIVWWMLIYSPVQLMLASSNARNASLRIECANNASCVQSLRHTQQSISQLRDVLDASQLQSTGSDWIARVMQIADDSGLIITSYQADAECAKQWYRCARARFDFSGTLDQILKFLSTLNIRLPLIGCKQWSIVQVVSSSTYTFSCVVRLFSLSDCSCGTERKTPST